MSERITINLDELDDDEWIEIEAFVGHVSYRQINGITPDDLGSTSQIGEVRFYGSEYALKRFIQCCEKSELENKE